MSHHCFQRLADCWLTKSIRSAPQECTWGPTLSAIQRKSRHSIGVLERYYEIVKPTKNRKTYANICWLALFLQQYLHNRWMKHSKNTAQTHQSDRLDCKSKLIINFCLNTMMGTLYLHMELFRSWSMRMVGYVVLTVTDTSLFLVVPIFQSGH